MREEQETAGFKAGNTVIKICEDCCRDRTAAEIDEILEHIAAKALEAVSQDNQ